MNNLRLGVMGLSPGNGHPYSWSAICNGYDPLKMQSCPFPVIPQYLSRQSFPGDAIDAKVTHVWAQDRSIAQHVAAAALIPTVVDHYEDMIGHVDGILLARDDAENHLRMSRPFLEAGLPVYIDKPIALDMATLDEIYRHVKYPGQLFSCSALRFSQTLRVDEAARAKLGVIRHVNATVPSSWEKYGVHLLDPVLNMLDLYGKRCTVAAVKMVDVHVVTADWDTVSATFSCTGRLPGDIRLHVFGSLASAELIFSDTFASFKSALLAFVAGIRNRHEATTRKELESVVSIIEQGRLING